MRFQKFNKILFITILAIFFLQMVGLLVMVVMPAEVSATEFVPQQTIPGSKIIANTNVQIDGASIGKYIQAWYKFAIAAVGILATVMIMGGGLIWLTAGGNAAAISSAKDWIMGTVVGLILALMSYTLLDILNPNLVTFKSLNIEPVAFVDTINCCFPESGLQRSEGTPGNCELTPDEKDESSKELGKQCDILKFEACKRGSDKKYSCEVSKEGDSCTNAYDSCLPGWFCNASTSIAGGTKVCVDGSYGDGCIGNYISGQCKSGLYCFNNQCRSGIEGDPCEVRGGIDSCINFTKCIDNRCAYTGTAGSCIPSGQPCNDSIDKFRTDCCQQANGDFGDCSGWFGFANTCL